MVDNFYDLDDNCVIMSDGECLSVAPCIHSVVFKPVSKEDREQIEGDEAFSVLYAGAESCDFHAPVFLEDDVECVIRAVRTSAYTDSWGCAVVKLKDGRFATIQESEDYTGHG